MNPYLIFGINNNASLDKLVKLISDNFNIELSLLNKTDFIKSNETYIYNNDKIINQILNQKSDFNNNIIDQVLYFETEPKFIKYINIIKSNNEQTLQNSDKNYILPKYYNNSEYDYYYVIYFNLIKYIQDNNLIDERFENLNTLFLNFDIKKYDPNFEKLYVFYDPESLFNETFFEYINKHMKIEYEDINYITVGRNDNVYIITDKKITKFLDEHINEICDYLCNKDIYYEYTLIKVDKNYLDKFEIDNLSIGSIYDYFKNYDNKHKNIILDSVCYDHDDDIEDDWSFVCKYKDYNSDRMDQYFVIYTKYPNKVKFI